jgi:hypothetical protein
MTTRNTPPDDDLPYGVDGDDTIAPGQSLEGLQTGVDSRLKAPPAKPHDPDDQAPDWVLIGVQDAQGVAVLAASNLTQAQLRRRVDGFKKGWLGGRYPIIKNNLVLEFEDFTMIRGSSYAECMRTLAEHWQPPEPGLRGALPSGG